MMHLSKRTLLVLGAAAALAACGKKEEPPAAPAPAPVVEAPKPEPLKAAWVYVGPVGDAGWTYAHDQGRKAVEAAFGDKVVTTFVEKVPEGADAERVIRDLATQGNKIIFATSFGFMEPMLKVAAEFPDVKFEHATGYKTADNMRIYDAKFFEDAYLAGVVAGHMTKTNKLGFVGSFPIPEVLRNINAYTLGARSVNPKVTTQVVWVNTWFDPPKESEAAQSLINGGADVLLQNTDSTAVLQTAEKNGKYAFGWDSDMSAFAPKAHLASCVVDWGPYYQKAIQDVLDGTWTVTRTVWGVKEGQNALVKLADFVPEDVKAKVATLSAGLKDGSFHAFTGPVKDNTGKERLAKDVQADQDWLDKIDFYVQGVQGKVPTGK
jgi:basic membrane protein A and related proteins